MCNHLRSHRAGLCQGRGWVLVKECPRCPNYTEIPDATIDLNATTPALDLGSILLLNSLYASQPFAKYDVEDTGATTLTRGDDVDLVRGDDSVALDNGVYAGSGTISTLAPDIVVPNPIPGLPPVTSLSLAVNPIHGHFIVDQDDGKTYFVSDDPLDADHIGVSLSGTLLGAPFELLNVSISEMLANPLLTPVLGLLQGALDAAVVSLDYDPDGTLDLDDGDVVPCFTRGVMIATPDGPVPVETLRVGDLVLTRDHGPQPVRWIGSRRLDAVDLAHRPNLRPVRIAAEALGKRIPAEDLLVSPQHRMLVQSKIAHRMFGAPEVLAAARQLLELDGVEIAGDVESVEYFHILFDRHEVVSANGALSESLYPGPMAMKGVGPVARREITELFPELLRVDFAPASARPLVAGRQARKLVARHIENRKPLYAH